MSSKGYSFELFCKHELQKLFPNAFILKTPSWALFCGDFVVINGNKVELIVECKKTIGKKWYMRKKDRKQFYFMKKFCTEHVLEGQYWIKENGAIRTVNINDMEVHGFLDMKMQAS
jgi:Holliday junction resolvase